MILDSVASRLKLVRDQTDSLVKYKHQKCFLSKEQKDTGVYVIEEGSFGEEEGWVQHKRISSQPAAWSHASPAVLDKVTGRVYMMKDKAQNLDLAFSPKTSTTSSGDSADTVRIAENQGDLIAGIICTCLNDTSREYIFFPVGGESGGGFLAIRDDGDGSGTPVTWSSSAGGWIESGQKKTLTMSDPTGWYAGAFHEGNIYVGVDIGDRYLVSRYGFGPKAKEFTCNINGHILTIEVDGQGSVLGVSVV